MNLDEAPRRPLIETGCGESDNLYSLVDLDSDPLVSIAPLPERQMLQDEDHVPWFHIVR